MTLDQYLSSISTAYKDGIATELYEGEIPSLTEEIINQIAHKIGLHFILAKDPEGNICMANNKEVRPEFRQTFAPTDILDYAYAILHSSNFSSAEKKILKTNFPYPKNAEIFWKLAELGFQIKQIHLLENLETKDSITYQQKIKLALSETNLLIKKIDKIILE
ncbi:MAG TPA: type ISP restriction/modification enzyme [Flavobacterium sp.]|uniref:type ISP restriction/modification enzyme n=1 Tax=Flavobacterium sp. TaxID=239 RepID=UPI002DBBC814|nr:type ISP restriction/modification enzyme [Flavobacterium sp.]HEU4791503.1 type ISP restriction/modification enzyme [Flavobacterium sp.]